MHVTNSAFSMRSAHERGDYTEQHEELRIRLREPAPLPAPSRHATDELQLSAAAQASQPSQAIAPDPEELTTLDGLKVRMLKLLLERLTGKSIEVFTPKELKQKIHDLESGAMQAVSPNTTTAPSTPPMGDYAVAYDYYQRHVQYESTQVHMDGVVQTSDGKSIAITLDLNLSRQLVEEQSVSIRMGDQRLFDPLVINLDASSVELTQRHFAFDLDLDGRKDQIAFVGNGSGLLALDKNADGVVNDGSELFGPQSGNGYTELSRFDQDGNQFIDETDTIYNKLRVWTRDAAGNDSLTALGAAGIGAIYLGHITSPYTLQDSQGQEVGQLRDTGLYLREDGSAGTVQQIDLVV